jgi:nitrite reductase (NO-forming)
MGSLTRSAGIGEERRPPLAMPLTVFGICCGGVTALLSAFAVAPAAAQVNRHSAAKTTIVNVIAGYPTELSFTLSRRSVPAGKVTFKITNKGVATHDFEICTIPKVGLGYPNICVGNAGATSIFLAPTQSATISVTLKPGIYEYLCTVPGHANAGMKGIISVGHSAPATLPPPRVATAPATHVTGNCPNPQKTTVTVSEFDYGFTLSTRLVPCGPVTFNMTNVGTIEHNFDISAFGGSTGVHGAIFGLGNFLLPGQSTTMTVPLDPGTYRYQCDVPQHAALGMVGSLTVTR